MITATDLFVQPILNEIGKPLVPEPAEIICDPKVPTYIGQVLNGQSKTLSIQGEWSPGPGHDFYGPSGSKVHHYNNLPKWSTVVVLTDYQGKVVESMLYTDSPIEISEHSGVHVYVLMNDDIYADNLYHGTNPLRATIK